MAIPAMANKSAASQTNGMQGAAPSPVPAGAAVRFARGAVRSRQAGVPITTTLGSSGIPQQHILPVVQGWARRVSLIVSVATTGNSATVALAADAPWNLFSQITLWDGKRNPRFQMRGYDAYLAENMGGYHLFKIESDPDAYTALTTGSGATAPTGTFVIDIPHEFGKEGIGCEPYSDASQRYTLDLMFNPLATIFSTPPNGTTTVTVRPVVDYYARPPQQDSDGQMYETTPPMNGTVQYWRAEVYTVNSGDNVTNIRFTGRYLRNLIFLFTDGSDVRSNTVRPDNLRIDKDNQTVFDIPRQEMQAWFFKRWGFGLATGVYPVLLGTLPPDIVPGAEWVDAYWPTTTAGQLTARFNAGAAGKLWVLYNELQFLMPIPPDL